MERENFCFRRVTNSWYGKELIKHTIIIGIWHSQFQMWREGIGDISISITDDEYRNAKSDDVDSEDDIIVPKKLHLNNFVLFFNVFVFIYN